MVSEREEDEDDSAGQQDRLSNLESGVTQHILSFLPIRDAVRTSVLSRSWRYKWSTLPCLVFNYKTISSRTSIEKIVDRVLLFRSGPMDRFKLSLLSAPISARKNICTDYIDKLIFYLAKHSIKELTLEMEWPFSAPNLYVCKDLTHLELCNFEMNRPPPPYFKGFRMLKHLHIRKSGMTQNVLENMIRGSPRLESMILWDLNVGGITDLSIDSPNLKILKIQGRFRLENASNLVDVSIEGKQSANRSTILIEFLLQLPRIQRLTLGRSFLKGAVDSLKEKLPERSLCLKYLSLSIALKNMDHILAAIFFLRSSPNLQELEISVCQENGEAISNNWLNVDQNCTLNQLRHLKLDGFSGSEAEADFTKFLFSNSPALHQLELSFCTNPLEEMDLSWLSYSENSIFNQLRVVKLGSLKGVKAEIDFIRFMLRSSPVVLEKMILQPASAKISWELAELLMKMSKCHSVHADIQFVVPPAEKEDSYDQYSSSDDDSDSEYEYIV